MRLKISKKIYIFSIVFALCAATVFYVSAQLRIINAAGKGETYLQNVLLGDVQFIGKRSTKEDSLLSSSYIIKSSVDYYDSYKFIDENDEIYYMSLDDGSLIKYVNPKYQISDIQNEMEAGKAAISKAKKILPGFFNYDYEYEANPHFGSSTIIISQINNEGTFTGNYISAELSEDQYVCRMDIINTYNPDADIPGKKEIEDIAYKQTLFMLEYIKAELEEEDLTLLESIGYLFIAGEDIDSTISNIIAKANTTIDYYETNVDDRNDIIINSYIQIAYNNVYWWRVTIQNVTDNADEFCLGRNNTYEFIYYIDPRTGEIMDYSISVS
ncbi:MAG: hypothetical protein JXN65_11820 [Clostridia bacterium]|nr:hypothetical protein [Clostridia bacterium]